MELDPLDPFSNFALGRTDWFEGDFDVAEHWFDRRADLDGRYAQARCSCAGFTSPPAVVNHRKSEGPPQIRKGFVT